MDLDLWYEGPTVVIADKPAGLPVHPESFGGTRTLVNALLANNRWLANMETSDAPGVVHVLEPEDRGMVVVAKSEESYQELMALKEANALRFSCRVRVSAAVEPAPLAGVTVVDHQRYGDLSVYDIETSMGDTGKLRREWLHHEDAVTVVVYRVWVPMAKKSLDVGLGARVWLPRIDLYTAPP